MKRGVCFSALSVSRLGMVKCLGKQRSHCTCLFSGQWNGSHPDATKRPHHDLDTHCRRIGPDWSLWTFSVRPIPPRRPRSSSPTVRSTSAGRCAEECERDHRCAESTRVQLQGPHHPLTVVDLVSFFPLLYATPAFDYSWTHAQSPKRSNRPP
jgi:hypothetical protein